MKRQVTAGLSALPDSPAAALAKESALFLLRRSIHFGHGRLAVVRLSIAVQTGARVGDEDWRYCRNAASASRDLTLRALLEQSEKAARANADFK